LAGARKQSFEQYNEEASSYWKFGFGAGLGYSPKFEGSSDYKGRLLPIIDVTYKDTFFINTSRGAGINVYNQNGLKAGPFFTLNFGRDEKDASYLAGSGDVDIALESGVFIEQELDPLLLMWSARYASFNTGHGGVVSDASVVYRMAFAPHINATFGGTVSWASDRYMESFFGVNANHAFVSNLREYEAKAGFKDVGVDAGLQYIVDEQVSVVLNSSLKKLVDNAASSPIVKEGDDWQFFGGAGILYYF
jgi:outer membrane scaffolding protein for murein synthesis (MipA/OmpV family)